MSNTLINNLKTTGEVNTTKIVSDHYLVTLPVEFPNYPGNYSVAWTGSNPNQVNPNIPTPTVVTETKMDLKSWASMKAVISSGLIRNTLVFGDSLFDVGNVYVKGSFVSGNTLNDKSWPRIFYPDTTAYWNTQLDRYWNGRFTNGPNVIDWIGWYLGLRYSVPSISGGNNFAYGGSCLVTTNYNTFPYLQGGPLNTVLLNYPGGASLYPNYAQHVGNGNYVNNNVPVVMSIPEQVNQYLVRIDNDSEDKVSDPLVILNGGFNDIALLLNLLNTIGSQDPEFYQGYLQAYLDAMAITTRTLIDMVVRGWTSENYGTNSLINYSQTLSSPRPAYIDPVKNWIDNNQGSGNALAEKVDPKFVIVYGLPTDLSYIPLFNGLPAFVRSLFNLVFGLYNGNIQDKISDLNDAGYLNVKFIVPDDLFTEVSPLYDIGSPKYSIINYATGVNTETAIKEITNKIGYNFSYDIIHPTTYTDTAYAQLGINALDSLINQVERGTVPAAY